MTQEERPFDEVKDLKVDSKTAQWTYPHLKMQVNVVVDEQGLKFSFKTNKEQIFQWPIAAINPTS